jgi:acetyltransferase
MKRILDKFFFPKSVAVVGASGKSEKVGHAVLRNLLGFDGKIYPVNPRYDTLLDLRCYARIIDLPETPDLVVFAVPGALIPDLLEECREKSVECVLVLSAGFKETGSKGEALFEELKTRAARLGIRIIGPNALGLLTPAIGLNASFAPAMPGAGRVAFISQSGALGSAVLDWAVEKNVGFSHFVSVGNMADIGFDQLIDYLGSDSRTTCILIYMENLAHARKFMSAARAFARSKPIVVLKAGISREGGRATLSHTGDLAGNDPVFDAAFRRAGVIRVQTIQQLFDCAQALAMKPLPQRNRLAIVTNAGGPAILAIDTLMQRGGVLADLAEKTIERLDDILPAAWTKNNPVDILGEGSADQYRAAVRACLLDPGTDAVLVILTAQTMTDSAEVARAVVAESKEAYTKPVYAAWMGQKTVRTGREALEAGKIPWYPFPERAVVTFMYMVRYRENLDMLFETPNDSPIQYADIRREDAAALIRAVRREDRNRLTPAESKQLLSCYGIPTEPDEAGEKAPDALYKVMISASKDPVFGPVITFGLGGPDAEIWEDRVIGLPPLNLALAGHLTKGAKVSRLLERLHTPPDFLNAVLCRFAYLVMDFPDLRELTIDPFIVHNGGGCAAVAVATLEQKPVVQREPFEHLSIQPYPTQWMKRVTLRNGQEALLRPIRPEDEPMEADLVHRTSRESLYFRFFGYLPGIDHRMLARFTHIDYDREMAIVAQVEEAGQPKIAGVVRIAGDGWRDTAEYAILVADAWHKQGLGGILTDYILEIARAQGYKKINASFLKVNGAMRRLFERKGFAIKAGSDETDYAELEMR